MALRVLVVCGGGASSSFLAQNMRKSAKAASVELVVDARSETEVEEYIGRIDVLLVGPHLEYMLDALTARVRPHGIKVALLPHKVYGRLDGAAAFKIAQESLEQEKMA